MQVPKGAPEQFEQLGTKSKFWFENEAFLFKRGRQGTGENWAEKVSAEVASDLGLPHASYELATFDQHQGVVTPNFVPEGWRLVHGNELIGVVSTRETAMGELRRRMHTVRRVYALLKHPNILVPPTWNQPDAITNAAGVFVGYLMLDALIGNQDRHEENWAVLVGSQQVRLSPTFDHASSLGRNESDEFRLTRMESIDTARSVDAYVRKAKSQLYDLAKKRLRTLEAFRAFAELEPEAGAHWQERLRRVSEERLREVISEVPEEWITEPARDFAYEMMRINRKLILAETFQ
ncbi:hypothetical protein BTJ49_04965 [Oleiagrimonas sp. MCCC 1A03011]|nr:hypothetical protein BTJ49_04965 [Oleiagrimonas sp. MCCC 1A03011]